MGTAFAFPCDDNNHIVNIVGTHLENDFIDEINSSRKHPALECKVPKRVNFLKFEKFAEEINKKVDLIVIAVVSKGIEWASIELSKVLENNIPILVLTKGLAIYNNNYEVLAHKMERLLKKNGVKETNISEAGGPCLARELANKVHTSVVFANPEINTVKKISKLVSTDYYHISTTRDVTGVGACAAIKNIFSMAVGAGQGLSQAVSSNKMREENYLNTAAALIQQSIYEMVYFVDKLNGKKETVMGLSGFGDLYVSVAGGRNKKMGEYLGQGISFIEAKNKKMPNITVEGADLALEIGKKVKNDFDIKTLPLMFSIIDIICEQKPLKVEWKNFKKDL